MQAICASLVFQTPDLQVNPATISPWLDAASRLLDGNGGGALLTGVDE